MIYSKNLKTYIPVTTQHKGYYIPSYGNFTSYTVKDNRIAVGKVDLLDTSDGVKVLYIENYHPDLYSGFGKVADQIEVEHCVRRGLMDFEITSDAGLNSHALHYLRGKRFVKDIYNKIIKQIIKDTPKGEQFNTRQLGNIEMFMPKNLIKKYLELMEKHPILK